MASVLALFDVDAVPLTGLSPTFITAFNAVTEAVIGSPPVISEIGSTGTYKFTAPAGIDFIGMIDAGATAFPRFHAVLSETVGTLGAFDNATNAPLTGITPTWNVLVDQAGAAVTPQPTFTELGTSGIYKFAFPATEDSPVGIIDLTAAASPRFVFFGRFAALPAIANVVPASGGDLDADFNTARFTPVQFDIADGDLALAIVTMKYAQSQETLLVHDGVAFRAPFVSTPSVRTAITGGFRYVILPAGGWLDSIGELAVFAVSSIGVPIDIAT